MNQVKSFVLMSHNDDSFEIFMKSQVKMSPDPIL